METKVLPLKGCVQNYNWGGTEYIPALLGVDNSEQKPYAELWLGAHSKGPAEVILGGEPLPLNAFIERNPEVLGREVIEKFGKRLPYLLKILDVKNMLSIQAHPTKAQAEAGYRQENERGIPLHAKNRNYRDSNHKPEVMVALSEFWLLHGFRSKVLIQELVDKHPIFMPYSDQFREQNLPTLYRYLMGQPQSQVDQVLVPYCGALLEKFRAGKLEKDQPEYWAAKAFAEYYESTGHADRGIFSIFLLNLVKLEKGQGIFQAAGVPHAYLEGINVELMANSDNVFRGGLTYKHIDVQELMKTLDFKPVIPLVLKGVAVDGTYLTTYPTPAPDFELNRVVLDRGYAYRAQATTPEIFFVLEGAIQIDQASSFQRGESFLVVADTTYAIRGQENGTVLFMARVPIGGTAGKT